LYLLNFNPLEGLAEVVGKKRIIPKNWTDHFNPLEGLAEVVRSAMYASKRFGANFNPLEGLAEVVSCGKPAAWLGDSLANILIP